jgi:hypothetical protein
MVSPMYRDPARYGIARVIDDPQNELARYLEHESASGMTREEIREAFHGVLGAATDALAALRGDNFLFYRYKSHIFLYLCRFGRDVFRRDQPPPRLAGPRPHVRSRRELPERLALREDVTLTELPFPYGAVRARLDRAWSDPTPLGGVAASASHAAPGATPVPAAPGWLAFLGREHRFLDLGRDTGRLLDAALANGTGAALQDFGRAFGSEHVGTAAGFLARAVDTGLLEPT